METASQIGNERHKTAVRSLFWHIGELRFFGKINFDAVRVMVRRAHQVVTLTEQLEHLVHDFNAALHIAGAGFDSLLFRQEEEIKSLIHTIPTLS